MREGFSENINPYHLVFPQTNKEHTKQTLEHNMDTQSFVCAFVCVPVSF